MLPPVCAALCTTPMLWHAMLPLSWTCRLLPSSPTSPCKEGVRGGLRVNMAAASPCWVTRGSRLQLQLLFSTRIVGGKAHQAEVMEKRRARELYEAARRQGRTAAHVGTK